MKCISSNYLDTFLNKYRLNCILSRLLHAFPWHLSLPQLIIEDNKSGPIINNCQQNYSSKNNCDDVGHSCLMKIQKMTSTLPIRASKRCFSSVKAGFSNNRLQQSYH